jgi:hypothetical protein
MVARPWVRGWEMHEGKRNHEAGKKMTARLANALSHTGEGQDLRNSRTRGQDGSEQL